MFKALLTSSIGSSSNNCEMLFMRVLIWDSTFAKLTADLMQWLHFPGKISSQRLGQSYRSSNEAFSWSGGLQWYFRGNHRKNFTSCHLMPALFERAIMLHVFCWVSATRQQKGEEKTHVACYSPFRGMSKRLKWTFIWENLFFCVVRHFSN